MYIVGLHIIFSLFLYDGCFRCHPLLSTLALASSLSIDELCDSVIDPRAIIFHPSSPLMGGAALWLCGRDRSWGTQPFLA